MDIPTAVVLAAMVAGSPEPPGPIREVFWTVGPVCRSPLILEQVLLRTKELGRIPAVMEHNRENPPGFCMTSPTEENSIQVQVFEKRPRPAMLIIQGESHNVYKVSVIVIPSVNSWGLPVIRRIQPQYGYIAMRTTYSSSFGNVAEVKP